MGETVRTWSDQDVAHIRFNRPQAFNAVNAVMAQEFAEACHALVGNPTVRAVVLSGEGKSFMAGGDVRELEAAPQSAVDTLLPALHDALTVLTQLPVPVIASVQGLVAGGGLGVALAADLCIAAQDTQFNFAYPMIGSTADCGSSWSLPRCVGLRRAMEIALLSQPLDAAAALQMGLVNRVIPNERLEEETALMATRLAQGATLALGSIKRLLRNAFHNDWTTHLSTEVDAFAASTSTADFREGCKAVLARRKPQFTAA